MDKIILTDVDGVLLDWETDFYKWLAKQGYTLKDGHESIYDIGEKLGIERKEGSDLIGKFNISDEFSNLQPWRDSVEYVKRFYNDGWRFIAITTAGKHPYTRGLRLENLEKVFGTGVVDRVFILPLHGDKSIELKKYNDTGYYWIEDKPTNAELGYKFGLRPLLMDTPFNRNYTGSVPRVNNWEEIYRIING